MLLNVLQNITSWNVSVPRDHRNHWIKSTELHLRWTGTESPAKNIKEPDSKYFTSSGFIYQLEMIQRLCN